MTFGVEKLEWCGYPIVKKFRRYLICFDRMYERNRRTDTALTAKAVLDASIEQQISSSRRNFFHINRHGWFVAQR